MVYHGPREGILPFFSSVGMDCPARKADSDFLQEVTSRKDQQVRLLFAPQPAQHSHSATTTLSDQYHSLCYICP